MQFEQKWMFKKACIVMIGFYIFFSFGLCLNLIMMFGFYISLCELDWGPILTFKWQAIWMGWGSVFSCKRHAIWTKMGAKEDMYSDDRDTFFPFLWTEVWIDCERDFLDWLEREFFFRLFEREGFLTPLIWEKIFSNFFYSVLFYDS